MTRTIADMESELNTRESAAPHLSGIPKLQNETAISRLYDALCAAHLAAFEVA